MYYMVSHFFFISYDLMSYFILTSGFLRSSKDRFLFLLIVFKHDIHTSHSLSTEAIHSFLSCALFLFNIDACNSLDVWIIFNGNFEVNKIIHPKSKGLFPFFQFLLVYSHKLQLEGNVISNYIYMIS